MKLCRRQPLAEISASVYRSVRGPTRTLLDKGLVDEAWIVDANPAIAAFWHSVIVQGEDLAALVARTTPAPEFYAASREALAHPGEVPQLELGYAAFIINRCSHSGIIEPRSGATNDVAARFNGPKLADRIRHVSSFGSRLRARHGDGIGYIEDLKDQASIEDELMLFVDPPYIVQGHG